MRHTWRCLGQRSTAALIASSRLAGPVDQRLISLALRSGSRKVSCRAVEISAAYRQSRRAQSSERTNSRTGILVFWRGAAAPRSASASCDDGDIAERGTIAVVRIEAKSGGRRRPAPASNPAAPPASFASAQHRRARCPHAVSDWGDTRSRRQQGDGLCVDPASCGSSASLAWARPCLRGAFRLREIDV